MIKVLQSWLEIGEAHKFLNRKSLPKHSSAEKNWDLYQLYILINSMSREQKIIDLGCGELAALKLLYAMGFKELYGVDFSISWRSRLSQAIRMYEKRSLKVPFHLYKRDLTETKFPVHTFDLAVCISVIEHGVNLEKFFVETSRILKSNGLLFITTDYWEEEIKISDHNRPFGLSWKVFCKKEIQEVVKISNSFGFSLLKEMPIPGCSDKCIVWNNQEYTFLSIVLKKVR
jgi:SAM-dependent methyltransferase